MAQQSAAVKPRINERRKSFLARSLPAHPKKVNLISSSTTISSDLIFLEEEFI
jgi:hypothetical protein